MRQGLCRTLFDGSTGEEVLADLEVLVGFDDDLAGEATRVANRIRGPLTHIHPALERVLGPKIQTTVVLELLACFGGPAGLQAAGRRRLVALARKHAPRAGEKLVDDVLAALSQQTVTVPGTRAAEQVLPRLAEDLTRSWTGARRSPPNWRRCWMNTLLPRS